MLHKPTLLKHTLKYVVNKNTKHIKKLTLYVFYISINTYICVIILN